MAAAGSADSPGEPVQCGYGFNALEMAPRSQDVFYSWLVIHYYTKLTPVRADMGERAGE